MMKLLVTGTLTTVSTDGDATIGYLVERTNGDYTTIAGGGCFRGTGATYTTKHRALQHLLASASPTREEREV
jgi:hypothetical protein